MPKNRRFNAPNSQSGAFLLDGDGQEVDLVKEILEVQRVILDHLQGGAPSGTYFTDLIHSQEVVSEYLAIINGDVDG